MTEYKYSRKEIAKMRTSKKLMTQCWLDTVLLATKPESPKGKCLHDHLCCSGGIETVRCAYCGKSMYHEPTLPDIEPMTFIEKVVRQLEERVVGLNNRVLELEKLSKRR